MLSDENQKLRQVLAAIQQLCIGEVAMGHRLDAEGIGRFIAEETGISEGVADPRLSDDPLTALAAVMRHHKLEFMVDTVGESYLLEPKFSIDRADQCGDIFSIEGWSTLGAEGIKPCE